MLDGKTGIRREKEEDTKSADNVSRGAIPSRQSLLELVSSKCMSRHTPTHHYYHQQQQVSTTFDGHGARCPNPPVRRIAKLYTEDIQDGRTTKRDRLNICVICRRIRNSRSKLHSLRKHVWVLVIYSFYFLLFGDPFFTRFSNHRYLVRRSGESNFFRSELSFGRKLNAVIASRNAKLETNRMSRGNCTPLEWIWVAEKKLRDTRLRILPIHILPWVSKFSEFTGWRCSLVGSSIPRVFRWLHR